MAQLRADAAAVAERLRAEAAAAAEQLRAAAAAGAERRRVATAAEAERLRAEAQGARAESVEARRQVEVATGGFGFDTHQRMLQEGQERLAKEVAQECEQCFACSGEAHEGWCTAASEE